MKPYKWRPQPDPALLAQAWANYDSNVSKRDYEAWARVLLGLGVNWRKLAEAHQNLEPMTAKEAKERIKDWSGWQAFANELQRFEHEMDLYLQKLKSYCERKATRQRGESE